MITEVGQGYYADFLRISVGLEDGGKTLHVDVAYRVPIRYDFVTITLVPPGTLDRTKNEE